MARNKTSRILKEVHEIAQGLHGAGVMSDRKMREFNALCAQPTKRPPTAGKVPVANAMREDGEDG